MGTDSHNDNHPAIPRTTVVKGVPWHWGQRTYVMGIINLTPDSFSGDGLQGDVPAAVALAQRMEGEGADIIDVGAESTRPGGATVSADEELRRLLPGLEAVCSAVDVPVSVDTYKAVVAERALQAGASVINDVWGLRSDERMARVAADAGVPVILMHNQDEASYGDLVPDIIAGIARSTSIARSAGVRADNIIIDPGIGFGKTADHNLELLRRLPELKTAGFPMLVGVSRKSTIGPHIEPAGARTVGGDGRSGVDEHCRRRGHRAGA